VTARELSPRRQELMARLRSQAPPRPGDHEPVPMRPGVGAGGLVLLHPAGGELFCYTPLVRALPPGPPVTGFAADPGDLELPLAERIPAVAAATLRRLADPGAHVFAGWSYGGALAFEAARQHAAATGETPPVVLLDSLYYGDVELEDEPTVRRRFVYDLARLSGRPHGPVRAALKDRAPTPAADPAGELRAMLALAQVTIALTDAELVLRYRTFRACSLALQTYRPEQPYPGPVTVVSADESADWQRARWLPVCDGPVELVRLPGDHYTLFRPPALDVVAAAVAAALGGDRVHG
jgi:thioesterase domain-containing protein